MVKVVLVQLEKALQGRIVQAAEHRSGLDVVAEADPRAAVDGVIQAPADVAVVVFGSSVADPLRLTQQLHRVDRSVSVVLLAEPGTEAELRKGLHFTPYLGEDVTCLSRVDRDTLIAGVLDAAQRRQQRQKYAQASAMMNRHLSEAVATPQIARHFGLLLDHAPIGVVTVDAQGSIYGWNSYAQTLLGRPERDVLGRPLSRLFADPEREPVHDYLVGAARGEKLPSTTFDRSSVKGEPQHLELSAVAIEAEPGRPGAIVLLQDVTAREQAREQRDLVEEALRRQQRWFQATVLSIGDAVIATDEHGRVTLMNEVAQELTGWSMDEATGVDSEQVFHIVNEYSRKPVESPVGRVLREGRAVGLANHTILIARDGTEVPIDDSGAPIRDSDGVLIGTVLVFRDIRERRKAEQALRGSEQRLRAIFEQVAVGIALVEPAGRLTEVNERFCEIVGYSRDELLAMEDPVTALTHPDDLANDLDHYRTLLAREQDAYQLEKRYVHKDGRTIWVNLGVSVLRDEDGEIQQVIGVAEDVTARKQAEAGLQASEERLRLVLESLTDYAIFTMDLEGRVTSWNNGARRLLGYEGAEIIGHSADIIFLEEHRRAGVPERERSQALAVGRASDDRWHVRKDGSRFWANGLVNALGRDEENPRGFVKILRDQTQGKRSREQLEARARQQAAVAKFGQRALAEPELSNLLDEAVEVVTRTLGVPLCATLRLLPEEGRLTFESGTGWKPGVVGRASIEAGGHSLAGYTLQIGHPIVAEDIARETRFTASPLLHEHGAVSAMSVIVDGPGEGPWGVLSAQTREHRVFSDDDVNFLQAMANILATAIWRSQTEQQLRELNQTLEQRVAERTAEAEQRAAQLRALTSELAQTEQRERRRLAEVLHDHLQQMLVAGKLQLGMVISSLDDQEAINALRRVDDLLDRSIDESRLLTVELSPPVLYDAGLVAGLDWLGRWMKEQHGLTVEVEADGEAAPVGNDLRVLLFQAARELLFNVVKHAEVDRAEVSLHRQGDHQIALSVCDHGRGFDVEAVERSEHDQGGFGLFSIRERLAWLGGKIKITSALGEGTCATLLVPEAPDREATKAASLTLTREAEDVSAPASADAPDSRPKRIRVLLADDHEIIRDGLVGVLNDQPDIDVVGEADNGHAALELVRRLQPDVVVLDVTMPRMNGIEAARHITSQFPDIRVIGLSVHESADMAEAMRNAGAATYLNKAGPSNRLLNAVRGVQA